MKRKVDFRTVNHAMRKSHKHGTKLVTISSQDYEESLEKRLRKMVAEKIKAKFADSGKVPSMKTATGIVREVLGKVDELDKKEGI